MADLLALSPLVIIAENNGNDIGPIWNIFDPRAALFSSQGYINYSLKAFSKREMENGVVGRENRQA